MSYLHKHDRHISIPPIKRAQQSRRMAYEADLHPVRTWQARIGARRGSSSTTAWEAFGISRLDPTHSLVVMVIRLPLLDEAHDLPQRPSMNPRFHTQHTRAYIQEACARWRELQRPPSKPRPARRRRRSRPWVAVLGILWWLATIAAAAYGTIIPLMITIIPWLVLVGFIVLLRLLGVLLLLLSGVLTVKSRAAQWLGARRDSKPARCVQLECTLEGLVADGESRLAWTDFSTISLSDDGVLLCLKATGSTVSSRPQLIWLPFVCLVSGTPEQARTWFRESGLVSDGEQRRFWHIRGAGVGSWSNTGVPPRLDSPAPPEAPMPEPNESRHQAPL